MSPPGGGRGDAEDAAQIRTFLIADVRGYTLFTQERGDEAAGKLAAKFADIARDVVESRGGTLLELRGDEALCVFTSTRAGIRAAVELQDRFVEETLDQPELPLTVGVGLDVGEAVPIQGGYRGGALNLAARLCGQARAGEILASREIAHVARRVEGVQYEDRGTVSLKGLSDPVAIVRVVAEGVDTVERLRPFAAPPPSPRRRVPRWGVAVAAGVVVALVAILIPLVRSGGGAVDLATNSVARLDGDDGSVEFASPLGQRPGASAVGFGSLWVAQPDRGFVARLDLDDGSVSDTIEVGNSPAGVAVGEGSVWVTNAGDGTVSRIDPETNVISDTLNAGSSPTGIAVGDGALWVADAVGAQLLRIDPASREIQAVALAGSPSSVAFMPNGVWVSVSPAEVARVDPRETGVTLTKTVGSGPTALLPAFGSIWVANHLDGTVSRLDPSAGRVLAAISVGEGPVALGAAGGSLWVANEFDDSITLIDPASNTGERTVPVGASAASLTVQGDSVWLAVGASVAEHRGGRLAVASQGAVETLDPAVVYASMGWQILAFTHDGLLAFKKVGGPDGTTLVPDLATALPEVSEDGLSYRFALREGIRYSNGQPVRPEDFRHGLERAIALSPDAASLLGAVDGAKECNENPTTCDLSESIVVDAESVTIRLANPDTDLPFKLALPFAAAVPLATPVEDQGRQPIPGTGPYMIQAFGPEGIELVRNPHFKEWSRAAQPDGFVDEISWRFEQDPASSFEQLSGGKLDWIAEPPRREDLASLQAAHPDQVLLSPQPFTTFIGFDVLKPPFNDKRVRQALNYAIDRERVVELFGGSTQHRTTCQILPPTFQGYAPFCPYTVEPEANVWSGPDRDRARSLIRDAGADGTVVKAVVMKSDPFLGNTAPIMRHVVDVMNEIGLDARLEVVSDTGAYFEKRVYTPAGTPAHPQVFLSGWFADYPGAGNFLGPNFGCEFRNPLGLCDEALDARITAAQQLQATDPGAANRAWTAIEHQLVEDALWAPLTNPASGYAFSARTGNIQVHWWGILLSRLWVQ